MNQYAERAMRYWKANLPTRYAQIQNPTRFFTDLGEEMAEQVEALERQIAGADPGGEDYLAKVGRLNRARNEAEMEVMREMLPEPENTPEDELEPDWDDGRDAILPFH